VGWLEERALMAGKKQERFYRIARAKAILQLAKDGLSPVEIANLRVGDLRRSILTGEIGAVSFARRHGCSPVMSKRQYWVVLSPATVTALQPLLLGETDPARPLFPSQRHGRGHMARESVRRLIRHAQATLEEVV